MTLFQRNKRSHRHFFPMSLALFGFCMSRLATCSLRIAWALTPDNTNLAIASTIFSAAGVLIAYVVVLLLALRILRATHPGLGWSGPLRWGLRASYFGLGIALVLLIAFTILNFFTLEAELKTAAMWVQRGGILYMLVFNLIAPGLVLASVLLPKPEEATTMRSQPLGVRDTSLSSQYLVQGVAMSLTLFIIGFRAGTLWADPRPASDPAWWQGKAAYYTILFALEVLVIYWLMLMRFDQKFWVPERRSSREGEGEGDGKRSYESSVGEKGV